MKNKSDLASFLGLLLGRNRSPELALLRKVERLAKKVKKPVKKETKKTIRKEF